MHKHHKTSWRTIYRIIKQDFSRKTDIFPEDCLKQCKNIRNEAHNVTTYVKNILKQTEMQQGLYTQVVIVCQNYLKIAE